MVKKRPAKKKKKSVTFPVRMTPEQRDRYQDAADRADRDLADWIRRVCDAAASEQQE